ncbi:MAG: single-stranded DNA-binding protein [Armatimonadota bacterium]|nr:single-stranded DNA-binding protein [Armatimonadota bacterium]MDR5704028.1 single-stranded DNA-binding protein [Armatimonadota bacterium]MDR7435872.1 single-stranded DNA-binding protein [Armatimonadota bacterium]
MLNRVILIGRLVRDPELRYVPSGQPVASFTLAVDRPFTSQQGEQQTDFIDIVAWRRLAEQVTQYLGKGRLVAVEGRLQIRSYETADGQKRKVAEVVATNIRFLDRKAPAPETVPSGSEEMEPPVEEEEDVPF